MGNFTLKLLSETYVTVSRHGLSPVKSPWSKTILPLQKKVGIFLSDIIKSLERIGFNFLPKPSVLVPNPHFRLFIFRTIWLFQSDCSNDFGQNVPQ